MQPPHIFSCLLHVTTDWGNSKVWHGEWPPMHMFVSRVVKTRQVIQKLRSDTHGMLISNPFSLVQQITTFIASVITYINNLLWQETRQQNNAIFVTSWFGDIKALGCYLFISPWRWKQQDSLKCQQTNLHKNENRNCSHKV